MKLIVYTDGASRGNPGPASYGFTVRAENGKLLHEKGEYIGVATNNTAEYTAVRKAMEWIKNEFYQGNPLSIKLFADSKLVAEQLSGRYKIKSPHLKKIIEEIKDLAHQLGDVSYNHIPRSQNYVADKLANLALDNR